MNSISICYKDKGIALLPLSSKDLGTWLEKVAAQKGRKIQEITYIFSSDAYLLEINRTYLGHDTLTDIITFDLGDGSDIEGEIYISLERIEENAMAFNVPFFKELYRVIVHGLLHLLGFRDKTKEEKVKMEAQEDQALAMAENLWKIP